VIVELSLSTRFEDGVAVIEAAGDVDVYSAPILRGAIVDLVEAGHVHLVLDLDGLEFLDSTGLGVLVGGLKRVRARRGSLRIVCTREMIIKPFRITGLTKVFPIHPTLAEAIRAAGAQAAERPGDIRSTSPSTASAQPGRGTTIGRDRHE
jgi:anti-sigma B factor antagonist